MNVAVSNRIDPVAMAGLPAALHRGADDLPFVEFGEGVQMQVLHIEVERGLWVVRQRMTPGTTLPPHRHAGTVLAFTLAGSWRYLEYPEVNVAGSYLYEPAGSTHTLHVPAANTEITNVWFAITGANLNLDDHGGVASVLDAGVVLKIYLSRCIKGGLKMPDVIGARNATLAYWRIKTAGTPLPNSGR